MSGTALEALHPEHCPDCGEELVMVEVDQPALFFHGGYGATERTIVATCPCGYALQRERSEITPREKA